jgi:hypothetical protein
MKKILPILAVPVLLIIGAAGWSFLTKPTSIPIKQSTPLVQKETISTTKTISYTPAPSIEIITTNNITNAQPLVYANPSVTIDAFETAIPEKKYADLSQFMTPTVTLIKYATSCCGVISKSQAIQELSYLSGAIGPWNFEDNNPIATKLQTNDPDNFTEVFVGTSSNNFTIGLKLNDDYLINKIILVSDYHLITGQ